MQLQQLLADHEQATAEYQETIQQLHRQNMDLRMRIRDLQEEPNLIPEQQIANTEMRWKDGGKAPFRSIGGSLVVVGNVVYFTAHAMVYSFNSTTAKWSSLPECPQKWGSLAVVQGLLTKVGGRLVSDEKTTRKLVSLTKREEDGEWVEQFPPMSKGRSYTTATTYQNHLIIAGGSETILSRDLTDVVQILNIDTLVWSTAASLPHPFADASATICGDRLYLLGGIHRKGKCLSVFSCSLPELIESCQAPTLLERFKKLGQQSRVWRFETNTPFYSSTCATVIGQLIAVGGRDEDRKKTTAVYKYDTSTHSWHVVSHMAVPRSLCYVAVVVEDMHTKQLLVVGGRIDRSGSYDITDSVEIADF